MVDTPLERIRARRLRNPVVQQNEKDAKAASDVKNNGTAVASAAEVKELSGLMGTLLNSGGLKANAGQNGACRRQKKAAHATGPRKSAVLSHSQISKRLSEICTRVVRHYNGSYIGGPRRYATKCIATDEAHQLLAKTLDRIGAEKGLDLLDRGNQDALVRHLHDEALQSYGIEHWRDKVRVGRRG